MNSPLPSTVRFSSTLFDKNGEELEEGEIFEQLSNSLMMNRPSMDQLMSSSPSLLEADSIASEMDSMLLDDDHHNTTIRDALLSPIKKQQQCYSSLSLMNRLDQIRGRHSMAAHFGRANAAMNTGEEDESEIEFYTQPSINLKRGDFLHDPRRENDLTEKKESDRKDLTRSSPSSALEFGTSLASAASPSSSLEAAASPVQYSQGSSSCPGSPILSTQEAGGFEAPPFVTEHAPLPSPLNGRRNSSTSEYTKEYFEKLRHSLKLEYEQMYQRKVSEFEESCKSSDISSKKCVSLEQKYALMEQKYISVEKQLKEAYEERSQFKLILSDYESTMTMMIGEAESAKSDNQQIVRRLQDEKSNMEVELQAVEVAFKDLKMRHDDMLVINEGLRRGEQLLNAELCQSKDVLENLGKRYDALKLHAEQKLAAANEEVGKVKGTFEKETTLMKAKVIKMEHQIKSLESALACKTKENSELMTICDELIQKMDAK